MSLLITGAYIYREWTQMNANRVMKRWLVR